MNKLRGNHKRFIYTTFAVTASVYFFLLNAQVSKATLETQGWFGISWSVVAGLVVFLYESWLWRVFNRKFDFGGIWRFTETQYNVNPDGQEPVVACYGKGSMRIVQDVRSICITEGQTYEMTADPAVGSEIDVDLTAATKSSDWWSISCELEDNASKIYGALDHESTRRRKGKPIGYGMEVFRVTERSRWGRPIKMSSTVYHCIGAGEPRVIDVSYTRDGFETVSRE